MGRLAVILSAQVIICMIGLASAGTIFFVFPSETRSHEELAKDLKEVKTKYKFSYAQAVAHEVASLLASAKDKQEPNSVLGMFSVDELLGLNHFSLDLCRETEFQRRDELCHKLEIGSSLHQYCADCLKYFETNCMLNRELVYKKALQCFDDSKLQVLKDFTKELATSDEDNKLPEDLESAIKAMPGFESNRPQLASRCKEFLDRTSDLYGCERSSVHKDRFTGDVRFIEIYSSCKALMRLPDDN